MKDVLERVVCTCGNSDKTRMIWLPYGEKTMTIMLSHFHPIPERYRQTDRRTDGRTDRQNSYINIARQYADAR